MKSPEATPMGPMEPMEPTPMEPMEPTPIDPMDPTPMEPTMEPPPLPTVEPTGLPLLPTSPPPQVTPFTLPPTLAPPIHTAAEGVPVEEEEVEAALANPPKFASTVEAKDPQTLPTQTTATATVPGDPITYKEYGYSHSQSLDSPPTLLPPAPKLPTATTALPSMEALSTTLSLM